MRWDERCARISDIGSYLIIQIISKFFNNLVFPVKAVGQGDICDPNDPQGFWIMIRIVTGSKLKIICYTELINNLI